ncbi:MAG: hypothetical protein EA351_08390 [Gemmatimonadales bacterium]|nr:MAG: hypothetical protein EA351_08390 [Gemmatimonadales bacterium]
MRWTYDLKRAGPSILILGVLLAGAGPLAAQESDGPPAPSSDAEVLAVVDRLFDGMRARDGDRVLSAFHPEARLVSTRVDDDGEPQVTFTQVADFAAAVGQGGDPWNEPYWDPVVQVDGALAQVWIFYRFYAGESFSHCGHNAIQMVKDAARGWVIVSLVDSRRTTDCDAPDA